MDFHFDLSKLTMADIGTLAAMASAEDKAITALIPAFVDIVDRCHEGGAKAIPATRFMEAGKALMEAWGKETNPKE